MSLIGAVVLARLASSVDVVEVVEEEETSEVFSASLFLFFFFDFFFFLPNEIPPFSFKEPDTDVLAIEDMIHVKSERIRELEECQINPDLFKIFRWIYIRTYT